MILTTLAFSAALLSTANGAALAPRTTLSVMIVGDSISQGREGDYTWRYRIWQWFGNNGIVVNFVGPHTGTVPPAPPEPPSPPPMYGETVASIPVQFTGGYAADVDGAFLNNDYHFAIWGQQVAQDQSLIAGMVSQFAPEYMLVELGFNDMGWFISDADGTLASMSNFVTNARSEKPDIKFAIANVPMRTFIGGRDDLITKTDQYNAMLAEIIPTWSTEESPIFLVDFRDNYSCEPEGGCPAGTDGLHPDALGEYQIAQAFADVLYGNYGLGDGSIVIPNTMPVRPCDTPTGLTAVPSPGGVTVTWNDVFGAYGYSVSNLFNGTSPTIWNTTAARYDTTWTDAGTIWEYQVQAYCANALSGWTDTVSVTANPTVAPGPSNIVVTSTANGVDLTWDAVEGDIDMYALLYWDTSIAGAFVEEAGFTGTSASIVNLPVGHSFVLAIQTWEMVDGVAWAGIPASANGSVIGGAPNSPTNFKVLTIDEGATVQMAWDDMPYAYEYRVWSRNVNEAGSVLTPGILTTTNTCYGATFLFPGAWNYEFCVMAVNGNYESPMSGCVIPSESITTVAACPTPTSATIGNAATPTVTWLPLIPVTPSPTSSLPPGITPTASQVCIDGTGAGGLADLCSFTCRYGVCPVESCTCTDVGAIAATLPDWLDIIACAVPGLDLNYGPLCGFACNYGYCPDTCINDSDTCLANIDPGDPVPNEENNARLSRLNTMYPGIYWDLVVPGGTGGCSLAQLNILEEATRVGGIMVRWSPQNIDDAAFQKYFVTDGRVSGSWSNKYRGFYQDLINNLKQVSGFSVTGHQGPDGRPMTRQRDRITYSCKPLENSPNRCSNTGVIAYTSNVGVTGFGVGTSFCNLFWQQRFMASITSGPKKNPSDLGSLSLLSFEWALIHEWIHADVVGYTNHIFDVSAQLPGEDNAFKIYGSSRCHDFAWQYVSSGNPNPSTVSNADNYAWTWVYRWLANTWGWTDNGSQDISVFEYTNYLDMPDVVSSTDLPVNVSAPISCSGTGENITCVYYGEYYDDYLLDIGEACDCNEDGCSDTSPSCCVDGNCPTCNCDGDTCSEDSPECCVSSTCLWATPTTNPPSSPTSSTPSEATCSIQGNLDNEGVAVWTNYFTDGGTTLLNAITGACSGLGLSDWVVTRSTNTYKNSNGVNWEATNDFRFTLGLARSPAELNCVNEGIAKAGGDPNNPTCNFTPALG